ncbi:hypothetical protein JHW43_000678 [Diplocarpon mali]|nr:hypothetical protein JHW43_000678 [Diplocarpon mali]
MQRCASMMRSRVAVSNGAAEVPARGVQTAAVTSEHLPRAFGSHSSSCLAPRLLLSLHPIPSLLESRPAPPRGHHGTCQTHIIISQFTTDISRACSRFRASRRARREPDANVRAPLAAHGLVSLFSQSLQAPGSRQQDVDWRTLLATSANHTYTHRRPHLARAISASRRRCYSGIGDWGLGIGDAETMRCVFTPRQNHGPMPAFTGSHGSYVGVAVSRNNSTIIIDSCSSGGFRCAVPHRITGRGRFGPVGASALPSPYQFPLRFLTLAVAVIPHTSSHSGVSQERSHPALSVSTRMGTLDLLPATAYLPPPPPGQALRRRRSLNTIMEDEEESARGSMMEVRRGRDLSPTTADGRPRLSDHFPTPRGHHFMPAPILQSDDSSEAGSISPSLSSAPWTRDSFTTDATEFDDLYDVSSDEEERQRKNFARRHSARQTTKSHRSSTDSGATRTSRTSLPALVIPSPPPQGDPWPGVAALKAMTSPVPPTPPPKVPVSPAIFSYLQSQEVPSCSAPPSLDGSFSSDQMAQLSAPPTPDLGDESEADGNEWGVGVQLEPAAMATLQALSGADGPPQQQTEQVIEVTPVTPQVSPAREMQQSLPPLVTKIHRNDSILLSPEQQRSMNALTRLEIPSPGGFFSALSPGARHTWHLAACTPESAHPPSSTTAEHFYKAPWSSAPVERMVELTGNSETMSDGLPTARPNLAPRGPILSTRPELKHEDSDETITGPNVRSPLDEQIVADEILDGHSPSYVDELNVSAVSTLVRTGLWLTAQSTYLAELINPTEDHDDEVTLLERAASTKRLSQIEHSPPRRTVRFSDIVASSAGVACPLPKLTRQESAYYRAFQHLIARSRHRDTFIHRIPRFEALQAQRISFPAAHTAQLLGKYQLRVAPPSATRRLSSNVARGDEIAPEDPEKLKRDREYEASTQMAAAHWNVMAIKLLNGGRLIAAPVAKRLARLSSRGPKTDGTPRDRARILDLGGQATCDWAWHCATEYPNTKVYTITTKSLRQLSNSNIRGPTNHRQIAVERLVRLPFQDSQFDLISAREVYTILRDQASNGQDEWDACLRECMRILKPGGYLEFSVMDSDIVNAGPLGLAKSVEFGFSLRTLGYDPTPTKRFISRLHAAGFVSIKRAWVFLPMGAAPAAGRVVERERVGVGAHLEGEAAVQGSTDHAASVCGLVGGWAWEKWLHRCAVQTGAKGRVAGVAEVLEEGRACGAGWRTVSGWGRKPW